MPLRPAIDQPGRGGPPWPPREPPEGLPYEESRDAAARLSAKRQARAFSQICSRRFSKCRQPHVC